MKSLLSIFSYLIAGLSGLGLSAYVATQFLEPVKAEVVKPDVEAKKVAKRAKRIEKELLKPNIKKVLIAQNTVPTPPPAKSPNQAPMNSPNQDIVVEGQKKQNFDFRNLREEFFYDPKGKRDPFAPYEAPRAVINSSKPIGPVQPLQKFGIEQLSVQGIIWGVEDPVAMIEAPNAKVYYVREREKIGNNNGYVAQIREGEVVIVETFMHRGNITSQVKILPLEIKQKK